MESKKTEKLITAIYLVTGFFDDKEPMKWHLRELGAQLLSHSEKGYIVSEILSLFMVAKHAGLVSDMNFEIINREFSRLLPEELALTDVFLKDPLDEEPTKLVERPAVSSMRTEPEQLSQEHAGVVSYTPSSMPPLTRPAELLPSVASMARQNRDSEPVKDMVSAPRTERETPKPLKEFGVVAVKKNSRQSTIIGLLKRKKEIMIKDVSPLIDGVSEKTIQRELLAMVKAGILKKEGEKRWSRYSLAE